MYMKRILVVNVKKTYLFFCNEYYVQLLCYINIYIKVEGCTLKEQNSRLEVIAPLLKGGYSLRKEFASPGGKFFPLIVATFEYGFICRGSYYLSTGMVSL